MPVPKADEPKSMPVLANRKVVSLKKVLVPLDFSDYASAAVDYAITIAGQADAHVVLLYVVEIPRYQLNLELYSAAERIRSTLNEMATKAMERLDSLCKEIRTTVACTASVRIGVPYEEILNEAEKVEPDLIVLGGKGVSALARLELGTTASQVVRFAQCSVLVARHRPGQPPRGPSRTAD